MSNKELDREIYKSKSFDDELTVKERIQKYCQNHLVFKQNDNFKVRWDVVIMVLSIYNCFIMPVDISFNVPLL